MIAIVKSGPHSGVELTQRPAPACPEDGVLVDVETVGLCGSDQHVDQWEPGYQWLEPHLPVVLGHEIVGWITQIGDHARTHLRPGSRVAVRPASTCGVCASCLADRDQRCTARRRLGLEDDGGLTERLAVAPGRLWQLDDAVPWQVAALTEPLTVARHAITRTALAGTSSPGTDAIAPPPQAKVAVVGPGPIGLAITQLLAVSGTTQPIVLGTPRDTDVGNDAVARRLGASFAYSTDVGHDIPTASFTHVFLCAGSAAAAQTALALTASGGTVVAVALGFGQVPIDLDTVVRREVTLRSSFGSTASDWDHVTSLMNAGLLTDAGIVSATFDLADGLAAFEALRVGSGRKLCVTRRLKEKPA